MAAGFLLEQAERWCDAARVYHDASASCGGCAAEASLTERMTLAQAACPSDDAPVGGAVERRLTRQAMTIWQTPSDGGSVTRRAREEAKRVAVMTAVAYGLNRWKVPESDHAKLLARYRQRVSGLVTSADVNQSPTEVGAGVYQTRAEVGVKVAQILSEMKQLKGADGQELPRVMVIGLEQYIGADGKPSTVRASIVRALVERALRGAGYDVVAAEQLAKLSRDAATLMDPKRDADPEARRLAADYRAEVILKLHARVRHGGRNGFGGFQSKVIVNTRAVDAATGRLLHADTIERTGAPICDNEAELYSCAAGKTGRGVEIAELVVQGLPKASSTTTFRVTLEGARRYGRQARPFIKMLERLKETTAVRQVSYGSGRLELEVQVGSKVSASTLVDRVLDGASRYRGLKRLDLRATRGRELSFELP